MSKLIKEQYIFKFINIFNESKWLRNITSISRLDSQISLNLIIKYHPDSRHYNLVFKSGRIISQ